MIKQKKLFTKGQTISDDDLEVAINESKGQTMWCCNYLPLERRINGR